MAEKIKISISPAVAAYVRPEITPEIRLAGCADALNMPTHDRVMLLFCLSKDAEPVIRAAALEALETLPFEVLEEYKNSPDSNAMIKDALLLLLQKRSSEFQKPSDIDIPSFEDISEDEEGLDSALDQPYEEDDLEEEAVKEDDEEFHSKYKIAQIMGIAEKIKMALSGDKEWRSILVKDSNKLVSGSVIKNPRITEAEILTLIKSGSPNDEIIRLICANKEWIKSYKIRKALVENNRTPIQNAMKYLGTMGDKDMAAFAKSKNISSVVSTMAKRLLLNKKK